MTRSVSLSRSYRYVGPPEIADRCRAEPMGHPVRSARDLRRALVGLGGGDALTCTYVVDRDGVLRMWNFDEGKGT